MQSVQKNIIFRFGLQKFKKVTYHIQLVKKVNLDSVYRSLSDSRVFLYARRKFLFSNFYSYFIFNNVFMCWNEIIGKYYKRIIKFSSMGCFFFLWNGCFSINTKALYPNFYSLSLLFLFNIFNFFVLYYFRIKTNEKK